MARNEVARHQRTRIHGALVEAVGQHGYEGTSIKQVIGLAGVSRRSFYEQFANKEECFLATFDLIVAREIQQTTDAYLATDGSLLERANVVFERVARQTREDRNATLLVLVEAQRVGPAGVRRLRGATGACEQMIAQSFAEADAASALPMPIVRGIAGGLHGAACTVLRAGDALAHVDLAEELMRWTLRFHTPAAEEMARRMTAALTVRMREISATYGEPLTGAEAPSRDERTRLLQGVLRLATQEDYRELSGPQIADEANVPIDVFCTLFDGRDDCYLAALDMVGDQLLAIAADPDLVSSDWPRAVRRVLARMMRHLADHPLHARTLGQEAFFAGDDAFERAVELSHSIATLLTEGAPSRPDGHLTTDAIAGAIWHTIRCQVSSGRTQVLAALSDHLAYVVLAPFIGAEAAAEIVTERCPAATDDACDDRVAPPSR
jgi:AcrR family transcriptional regulator